MAGFGQPLSHDLREEWRRLSSEARERVIKVAFDPTTQHAEGLRGELRDLGLSDELATWVAEEAVRNLMEVRRQIFEKRLTRIVEKSAWDYFNRVLIQFTVLAICLIWFVQEVRSAQPKQVPLGLGLSCIFAMFALAIFMRGVRSFSKSAIDALRKWRKRNP